MCEFKFCRGRGACFLSQSSPCPGKCPGISADGAASEAARRIGLKYEGFLDRDFVIEALGLDQSPARPANPAGVLYVVPKVSRAVPLSPEEKRRAMHG